MMSEESLERLMAFNREVAALAATGMPIDIGAGKSPASISEALRRIDATLTSQMDNQQTVERLLEAESSLPERYRQAARTLLVCDNPTVALQQVAAPALAERQLDSGFRQSLAYPLVVLALTYTAFVLLCGFATPTITALYQQLSLPPSASLSFLALSRESIQFWGPGVPIVVLLLAWWFSRRESFCRWLPGYAQYMRLIGDAETADRLAALIAGGLTIEEGIELTADTSRSMDAGPGRSAQSAGLLNWAIYGDLGGEPRERVLRFVANTYRQKAERQARIWRFVAPAVFAVLIGGTVVLGYALSLFLPLVQLLKDISLPGGG